MSSSQRLPGISSTPASSKQSQLLSHSSGFASCLEFKASSNGLPLIVIIFTDPLLNSNNNNNDIATGANVLFVKK